MTWQPGADKPSLAPPAEISLADRNAPPESGHGTTVELYVRSLSDDVQPLLDETLRRLREAETVDEVEVTVYGRSFDPTGSAAVTETGRALAGRLDGFRRWAGENDASFGPFFRTRTVERLTGETCTRVDLPTVTLAEYRDGELAFVAPCRLDERQHGVLDRARRLADGQRPEVTSVGFDERTEPAGEDGTPVRT